MRSYSIAQSKIKQVDTAQYSFLERCVRIARQQPQNDIPLSPPLSPGADKSVFVEVINTTINETMALAKTPILCIGVVVGVPDSTYENLTIPFRPTKQSVIDSLVKEFEQHSDTETITSFEEESEDGSNGTWSIASTGLEKLEITVKLFMEPL